MDTVKALTQWAVTEAAISAAHEAILAMRLQALAPDALDMVERMAGVVGLLYAEAETFSDTCGNSMIDEIVCR